MAKHDFRKIIIKYAKELAKDRMTSKSKDFISYRIDENSMYITKPGADFSMISEDDITIEKIDRKAADQEIALHSALYVGRGEVNAIIHSHHEKIEQIANEFKSMKAPLDDMAQIVGPTLRVVKVDENDNIIKTLKGRSACLIKGNGALSTGRTLAEAHTGAMVLFKACKCHVDGKKIGGVKTLPFLESFLMHKVYQLKYSSKNQELMVEKEREEALV